MQDLTLVGLTEDKAKLVLVSDTGEKYTLPADAKLRAALRGDLARHGQLEIRMESALRPRDIQARIRAGESPENVADAAQTSIERIMSYATPVLAERAHIADRAQRASVRRKGGEGPARVFGEAVAEQLRAMKVDPSSADWDSWRREDGRWTVTTSYRSGEESTTACFVFDVQGRYVVAEDDEARTLLGETPARAAAQPVAPTGPRRLSAVDWDSSLSLGDDAIELVNEPDAEAPAADPHDRTVDLTQAARDLRAGTPTRSEVPGSTGDADWMATQATDRPRTLRTAPTEESAPPAPEATEPPAGKEAPPEERPAQSPEPAQEPSQEPTVEKEEPKEAPQPAPKKAARKGRRASVPSWDEIMFGGGRSE